MLTQNIEDNRMSASKKMCEKLHIWEKLGPGEDLGAEIIWNLGSKRAHMTTYTCTALVEGLAVVKRFEEEA